MIEVQIGHHPADLLAIEQFCIDAVHAHCITAPGIGIALAIGMEQIDDTALGHHGIVVEILFQPFPELHRELVERLVAGQKIIGTDDRRVAADIARADIALFQHGDIGNAEFLGEIIGRCQAMPAAADDDHVIMWFRLRRTPHRLPMAIA